MNSTLSGVGYNIAKALTSLGNDVRFLSLIGSDFAGRMAGEALAGDRIPQEGVLPTLEWAAQSVILYEAGGRSTST